MKGRIVSGVASVAVIAGSGYLGYVHTAHDTVSSPVQRTTRTVSPVLSPVYAGGETGGCSVHVRLFEDGSWSGESVQVTDVTGESMTVADAFTIAPAPDGSFISTENGTRTLVTAWPISYGEMQCSVV